MSDQGSQIGVEAGKVDADLLEKSPRTIAYPHKIGFDFNKLEEKLQVPKSCHLEPSDIVGFSSGLCHHTAWLLRPDSPL